MEAADDQLSCVIAEGAVIYNSISNIHLLSRMGPNIRQVSRFHREITECKSGTGFILVVKLGKHRARVESVDISKFL